MLDSIFAYFCYHVGKNCPRIKSPEKKAKLRARDTQFGHLDLAMPEAVAPEVFNYVSQ